MHGPYVERGSYSIDFSSTSSAEENSGQECLYFLLLHFIRGIICILNVCEKMDRIEQN